MFSMAAPAALAQPAPAPEQPAVTAPAAPDAAAPTDAAAPEAAPVEAAPVEAAPEEEAAPAAKTYDTGNLTWMLVSTILVLLMIVPGLALFYGGLVRTKNMLSMLMQVTTVTVIGMIAWALWGYSLSFTDGGGLNKFIGGTSKMFLNGAVYHPTDIFAGVETFSVGVYIPELVFVCFQMTFACITAALVLGGVAERLKFAGVVIFAVLWPLLSYYPMAHMVWWWSGATSAVGQDAASLAGGAGQIWAWGALDFAGGTVVHINAGIAALMGALILGKRTGYKQSPMPPHSLVLTYVGAGLLWVGWFGFNAGSNLEANGYAAVAMVNTLLATAAAGLSWVIVEWVLRRRPSMLGLASGIVAGLVAVTPAAGFAGPMGAIVLGLIVSPVCVLFCSAIKGMLKYDDSLDAFGIHAIGGIIGAIGTGILVDPALGGAGIIDWTTCSAETATCGVLEYNMASQVTFQAMGVGLTVVWSAVASTIVWFVVKIVTGGRVSQDVEEEGIDINEHGEAAYHP
ncbi:MAG: ammonium transporter [Hyphomonadaceae bacterium]|nr:ammonium transporter [Hyphomonadaceae bacterium]